MNIPVSNFNIDIRNKFMRLPAVFGEDAPPPAETPPPLTPRPPPYPPPRHLLAAKVTLPQRVWPLQAPGKGKDKGTGKRKDEGKDKSKDKDKRLATNVLHKRWRLAPGSAGKRKST